MIEAVEQASIYSPGSLFQRLFSISPSVPYSHVIADDLIADVQVLPRRIRVLRTFVRL